jgi:hypothetical protein
MVINWRLAREASPYDQFSSLTNRNSQPGFFIQIVA